RESTTIAPMSNVRAVMIDLSAGCPRCKQPFLRGSAP
ncbi:MAG: hypothetical protein FD160_3912, partial [Caulobacteraceae bacterium]